MYQQETQLYYLWNTTNFFQKNALTFLNHKYSKLFQFNFPKTYLSNLCIAGRLKLLGDDFFKNTYVHYNFFGFWYRRITTPQS